MRERPDTEMVQDFGSVGKEEMIAGAFFDSGFGGLNRNSIANQFQLTQSYRAAP